MEAFFYIQLLYDSKEATEETHRNDTSKKNKS